MSRILGIDYGEKRIGLALSDPLKIIAKPYKTISCSTSSELVSFLKNIIKEKDIDKIIIGIPYTLKNKNSEMTEKVIEFIDFIKNNLSIDVIPYDERLTSQIAKQSLILQGVKTGHNKKDIDKTAAAIFLQNYLDELLN